MKETRLVTLTKTTILLVSLCGFVLVDSTFRAGALDPQPYTVAIDNIGDSLQNAVIRESSQLVSLREIAPASPFALIERSRSDVVRIQTALDSFGYYQNSVSITIDGLSIADPRLAEVLDAAARPVSVRIVIDKGGQYRLGQLDFEGIVPKSGREALGLKSGDPAIAATVLDARTRVSTALEQDGYAFVQVDEPAAVADDANHRIHVTFRVKTGPRAHISRVGFKGLKRVQESFVRRSLGLRPGELYSSSRIDDARRALTALGVFSSVTVEKPRALDNNGNIELVFDLTERAPRTVTISGNYATDLGLSLSVGWSHHNLLGNAEQLNLLAAGNSLGTASAGLGYNLTGQFIRPMFFEKDQLLELDISGVKQQLDAYDQTAETFAIIVRRKFSDLWSGGVGLSLIYDDVMQQGTKRLYQLIGLPLSASYDSTHLSDVLSDPVSGARLSVAITPTVTFGASNLIFGVLQASASTYIDLGKNGRSILALRALAGSIVGGSNLEVPPDQRLYAGGSATVRGFAYQSIGPRFSDGRPMGAKSVDAATVEIRQRIGNDWGAVAFLDAGQASAQGFPLSGDVRVGAGLGARYYTSIGVLRADVAVPVNSLPGGDAFELYIGLGQAF